MHSWKEYFIFTKKERVGIITLIFIIGACIVLPFFCPSPTSSDQLQKQLSLLQKHQTDQTRSENENIDGEEKKVTTKTRLETTLFEFDPNKLPVKDWLRLGVNEKVVHTIQHYLEKGGHFRRPEDLGKIYGMQEQVVKRLMPYVRINSEPLPAKKWSEKKREDSPFKPTWRTFSGPANTPIEINSADSAAWVALPGIGPWFAHRIINFRDRLGGFVSVGQVAETYGLSDSTFQLIK